MKLSLIDLNLRDKIMNQFISVFLMLGYFHFLWRAASLVSLLSFVSISSYFYNAIDSKRSARCSRISILKLISLISSSYFGSISCFFATYVSFCSKSYRCSSSLLWMISARDSNLSLSFCMTSFLISIATWGFISLSPWSFLFSK